MKKTIRVKTIRVTTWNRQVDKSMYIYELPLKNFYISKMEAIEPEIELGYFPVTQTDCLPIRIPYIINYYRLSLGDRFLYLYSAYDHYDNYVADIYNHIVIGALTEESVDRVIELSIVKCLSSEKFKYHQSMVHCYICNRPTYSIICPSCEDL